MKITTLALPTGAAALAALLLTPTESVGYSTLGGSLNTTQRDVRVYNNFTDPGANNNTTPDANFPGYDGAERAIWKACIEWASAKHGTGEGDPHQPGGLGSGRANFDPTWQGNATGTGTWNSNIHSQLSGNGGSTYAYCESPISDGWRIRYYEDPWDWKDGPNEIVSGVDLQGIATHEYGHALGLDHSTVGGATMQPSTSPPGNAQRSIATDDKSGVQFIYGAKDTSVKPRINSVSGGVPLTITGENFSATNNDLWFTQAGSGGNGVAVKATGFASSLGGTVITIASPPGNAGPGDVLVQNKNLSSHQSLSNPYPWDPNAPICGDVVNYCTAGSSAAGCTATLTSTGTPSGTASSGFTVSAVGVEGDKDGLIFFGENGAQANSWGSGTSFQCVVPPVKRTGLQDGVGTQGACDGTFALDFNAYWTANPQKNPGVGVQVNAQLWYRDPFNTGNQTTSLSDAVEFTTCP